jgi:hypothetical protein
MKVTLARAMYVASALVGVGLGFWTAQLRSYHLCPSFESCPGVPNPPEPLTFATWQCALFGAGAAAVLLVASTALARPRPRAQGAVPAS